MNSRLLGLLYQAFRHYQLAGHHILQCTKQLHGEEFPRGEREHNIKIEMDMYSKKLSCLLSSLS